MCGDLLQVIPADVGEAAAVTLRTPGNADSTAVIDKAVTELIAFFGRNDAAERTLHLLRFPDIIDKADQIAEADTVGVGDYGRLPVNISENEVGALAADAWQGKEFLHRVRDGIVILCMQNFHAGGDVAGLGMAKTAGTDNGFNLFRHGRGEGSHCGEALQEVDHDDVDPCIRALRGKAHTDQKLPGIPVVQCAFRFRIFLFQAPDHLKRERLFVILHVPARLTVPFLNCPFSADHFKIMRIVV